MADQYEGNGQPPVSSGWLAGGLSSVFGAQSPTYAEPATIKPAANKPASVPTPVPTTSTAGATLANDCESAGVRPIVLVIPRAVIDDTDSEPTL